jgi:hypothetical protein
MRSNDMRKLDAWCTARDCYHHTVVSVDHMSDDAAVPSIGPRLRCLRCGHRGADARPNWTEHRQAGT